MKKDDISQREKSAAVGLVVCFVAMIAIVMMIVIVDVAVNLKMMKIAHVITAIVMKNSK